MWIRLKQLHENNRNEYATTTKRRYMSRPHNIHPTADLDNDVQLLQSYVTKRRPVARRDKPCDSNHHSIQHQHPLDIVAQEVQEWKKIQTNVKVQLAVLTNAVRQLHQSNARHKVPNLEMIDN